MTKNTTKTEHCFDASGERLSNVYPDSIQITHWSYSHSITGNIGYLPSKQDADPRGYIGAPVFISSQTPRHGPSVWRVGTMATRTTGGGRILKGWLGVRDGITGEAHGLGRIEAVNERAFVVRCLEDGAEADEALVELGYEYDGKYLRLIIEDEFGYR